MTTKQRTVIAILLWLAAIALAAMLDRAAANAARDSGINHWLRSHRFVAETLKVPGTFVFPILIALIAIVAHEKRWLAGVFVILATSVSGINRLIKWIAGRTRPFKLDLTAAHPAAEPFILSPFPGGWPGLFSTKNLCFPSGHAAVSFATAAAVAMLWPRSKWRWIAYVIAAICSAERVAENAHWFSDTVAGAAIGIGGVHLIAWIVSKVYRPSVAAEVASQARNAHESRR